MTGNQTDFLLEIGVEEMPARFLDPALQELGELAEAILTEKRLPYQSVTTYGAPRRMALLVSGLADSQASLSQEVKGPALKAAYDQDGNPTKAVLGFAKSQGVEISALFNKEVKNVEYVYALKHQPGLPAMTVLQEIAPALITGLRFPKPMRWGRQDLRFARPIRWLVALLGDEVVDFTLAGCTAGRVSRGHRFLSTGDVSIDHPAQYVAKMREAFVVVEPEVRRQTILEQVHREAAQAGGVVEMDEDLLNEVTNLVEYPTAFTGEYDGAYLQLPKEVLVTLMREHQRYFPVAKPDGSLLPKFIGVGNGGSQQLATVRVGNEKVLRARLADAEFFFKEDLKTPLENKISKLEKIVFQETLGTVFDKVVRLGSLVDYLADAMGAGARERELAKRAASLAKADLVTNMVYEFPELQGSMGREYAARSGEEPEVAAAVFEHYLPRFAGDELPQTLPGRMLSIADKMDNITGSFAIGIRPSGSQDPYALRRQALGISHILLTGKVDLSLADLIAAAYRGYEGKVQLKVGLAQVTEEISEFFGQRFKGIMGERGYQYDTVEAVMAAGFDNLYDVSLRAEALTGLRPDPAFGGLLTTFIRANNLAKNATDVALDPNYLEEPSEKELYQSLTVAQRKTAEYLAAKDYPAALIAVAAMQAPLNRFFDEVMVMAEDERLKQNRLALLRDLAVMVKQVADLSKIVTEDK